MTLKLDLTICAKAKKGQWVKRYISHKILDTRITLNLIRKTYNTIKYFMNMVTEFDFFKIHVKY